MKTAIFLILILAAIFGHFAGNDNNPAPQGETPVKRQGISHTDTATPEAEICPLCLETDCIYFDINSRVNPDEPTDGNIYDAVIEVCRERSITDTAMIHALLNDYYLNY